MQRKTVLINLTNVVQRRKSQTTTWSVFDRSLIIFSHFFSYFQYDLRKRKFFNAQRKEKRETKRLNDITMNKSELFVEQHKRQVIDDVVPVLPTTINWMKRELTQEQTSDKYRKHRLYNAANDVPFYSNDYRRIWTDRGRHCQSQQVNLISFYWNTCLCSSN